MKGYTTFAFRSERVFCVGVCILNSPYIIIMVDVEGESESQKRQLEPVWRGNEAFRTS